MQPQHISNVHKPQIISVCSSFLIPASLSYGERLAICLQHARNHSHDARQQQLYKVPPDMRHANASEFDPIFFSIGLFNARLDESPNQLLEPCDYHKIEIAKALTTKDSFEQLVKSLEARVGDIRRLYRQQSCDRAAPRDIAYILALDALTVVAAACYQEYVNPRSMCTVIWRDAFLMEQQLPLFVLQAAIHSIAVSSSSYDNLWTSLESASSQTQIEDLVNFYALQTCYPFTKNVKGRAWREHQLLTQNVGDPALDMQQSLLSHIHSIFIHAAKKRVHHVVSTQFRTLPTASQLRRTYGIHIEVGDGDFTGIRFDKKSRVLTIPEITVFSTTKSYLLNLVAQEAAVSCYDDDLCPVSSFVLVMGFLIETEEDVRVLEETQVMYNQMGSVAELAAMWSSLAINLPISLTDEDSKLIDAVREACQSHEKRRAAHCLLKSLPRCGRWRAVL